MLKRNFDILERELHPGYRYSGVEDAPSGLKSGEFDLLGLLKMVRRRLSIIVGISVIGTLLAIIYSLQLTPLYTARATLLVDPRQKNVVDAEAVLSGIGGDWAALESEVEIIRSAAVAERVVRRLKLDENPPPRGGQPSFTKRLFSLLSSREKKASPINDENRINYLARYYSQAIGVQRVNDTYIFSISFRHTSPGFAAQVANAFADEYLVDQLEAKFEATRRANEWLNERVTDLRQNVREAEQAVELFKAEKDIVEAAGSNLDEQQIARLNEQLILARAQSAEAKARLDQLTEVQARGGEATSFADQLQSRIISELRSRESEVRREYAELSSKYGRRHPSVINVSAQLADIRRQLAAEVSRIEASTRNAYKVAKSREESIETSLNELRGLSADTSRDAIRLRELERDAAATRALFESFLARFKETTEQESLQTADSRIIERAVIPTSPTSPNKKLIVLIGAFVSLGAGIGVAFLLELLDSGFRTGDQLEEVTGAPVLASMPTLAASARSRGALRKFLSMNWLFGRRRVDEAAVAREMISRQVLDHPLSPFTEAIRSLRMGLRYANLDNPSKVVLITSSLPGEGKSTIASNLAQHAANTGEKVLLIDMDLRHPALTHAYAEGAQQGIVELVTGEAKIGAVVKVDDESKLRFIPASRSDLISHTSEVLGSKKIKDFLTQLRDVFDLIVIDSSPLLPVTDGRALIDAVDSVVLVVKWETTNQDAVRSAFRQSFGLQDKLIGTVLSQVNPQKARYYDYYKSGYYTKAYPYYYADEKG
jgi:exopolysaccharide transport family protein